MVEAFPLRRIFIWGAKTDFRYLALPISVDSSEDIYRIGVNLPLLVVSKV